MTLRFILRWGPLLGLLGLIIAYWFLADAIPSLVASSPRLMFIFGHSLKGPGPYLGFSLLFALWGALEPMSLALLVPPLFLAVLLLAVSIATMIFSLLVVFVLIIGLHQNTFPWMLNWMLVSGLFVAPLMLLGAGVVLLLATTAKGLQQTKRFKRWEIGIMLLGSSWIGLAIGWS